MKNFTKALLVILLCLNFFFSNAQQGDTLEIQRNKKGEVSFARFKPDIKRNVQEAVNFLKTVLITKPDANFV